MLCTLTCELLLSFWLVTKEAKALKKAKHFTARRRIVSRMNYNQGYSGAGTWWSIIPANIFESERRSDKYCFFHSQNTDTTSFRQISSYC